MSTPVGTQSVARAAAGLSVLTVASRLVGFGRVAVLARTLGVSCVGDTYQAANSIPNIVFEIVAGGALASLVVPVLAGAVASGDRQRAGETVSGLLTWTLAVLTPLAVVGMITAPTLMRALAGSHPGCGPQLLHVGGRLLVVFMPQVVLYGVGVIFAGVLQAHRRFLAPAIAPLLSSLVVVGAYLAYAASGPTGLRQLSRSQELILSVGTTLGVAVLSLCLLGPVRRCKLRLRPVWRFPPGVGRRVRSLALAGLAGLVAQQLALAIALRLATSGREGSVVVFQLATALFLLPWAVLAVPVATASFPDLAASMADGQASAYEGTARRSLLAVIVTMAGGTALLVAVSGPAAQLLAAGVSGSAQPALLAHATVAFAPGLLGAGLVAFLSRALYARGDVRTPAAATVTGWLVVGGADVALVSATSLDRAVALGVGNSVGMSAAGALLLAALHRAAPGAVRGLRRGAAASLVAGGGALAAAAAVPTWTGSDPAYAGSATLLVLVVAGVFLGLVRVLAPDALPTLRHG